MKSRNNKGFTLTELMVVVAIMGVGVTIAVTSYYSWLPHMNLKASARDIATSLNITRMRAIAANSSRSLTFNDAGNSFNNSFGDPMCTSQNRRWTNLVDIWAGGVGAKYDVTMFTGNQVTYTSLGTVANLDATNDNYAVYLRNIPSTGEEYRVKVSRLSGKPTVERWDGVNTWTE